MNASDSSESEYESNEIKQLHVEHEQTRFASNSKKDAVLHILAKNQSNASPGTVQCTGGCQLNEERSVYFTSLRHAMAVQQGWCHKALSKQSQLFQTLVEN